jgi:hypothetical protein
VLARFRRRELAWVTIPLVTAIFTVAAFVGATGASPLLSVSARVTWWVDGIGADVVAVGVRAPVEGSHQVMLPGDGWAAHAMIENGRAARLLSGDDHRVIQMDLSALQLGGVIAARPASAVPPLTVDAIARPAGIEVTVQNISSQLVERVVLRAATARATLGTLAPGESKTNTFAKGKLLPRDPYQQAFDTVEPGPNGIVEPPASMEALLRTYLIDGSPGMVWAVGQSGVSVADPLEIEVDGAPPRDAGHLVAVGTHPRLAEDGTVSPFAVDRAALVDAEAYRPGPLAVEGARDAYLRFRFPPSGDLSTLFSDLERSARSAQFDPRLQPNAAPPFELTVWDHDVRQWLPLDVALPPEGRADPGSLLDPLGTLYVRASGDLVPFDFSARTVSGVAVGP